MIDVRGLSFAHHGREPCIRGLDLEIGPGEAVLAVGPSGSAKTTLLRLVAGLIPRVQGGRIAGRVTIDGQAPASIAPRAVPRMVGYVPQDPETVFVARTVERELTCVLENVGEPRPRRRARVDETLAELGVEPLAQREVPTLSGGEAARVAIAAALVAGPQHLLLDEPTSQLDEAARLELAGTLRALRAGGLAMAIATHDPGALARVATRTLTLAHGASAPASVLPPPRDGEPLLALGRASHRYSDDAGVGPVDLDVAHGEVVALAGPNGCGKTTLLHLAAGLIRCHDGRARIAGADPASLSPPQLAARVGLAFQHPAWHITQDTLEDEVAFTSRVLARACDVRALLSDLGLAALSRAHPWDLSGGERERLAIASAAAHDPPLLLLDEPTRGLDAGGLARVAALLARRSANGLATVIATHQPAVQALAHRVVRLERGRIVGEHIAPQAVIA